MHYNLLQSYQKDLFKKRKPATNILVFLISESTRAKKPYAIPLQCIPHAGLQDQEVRAIADGIKLEMTKIGMKVEGKKLNYLLVILQSWLLLFIITLGLVTDGEFNSLRSKGSTRPLSIVQIRSESRKKYARMSEAKMRGMLTVTGNKPS